MARRPQVFATRALPGPALDALAREVDLTVWPGPGVPPPRTVREAVRDADGLICLLTDRVDAALLDAGPRLRVVSSCSVGVDHVDLDAATARGIPVGHTPGVLTETTADLAVALLLAAARRIPEADRFVRAGEWTPERSWEPDMLLGRDLHEATVGVIGLGAIGRAVARRLRGFDCRILGWTRSGRTVAGVESASLARLLAESDFVTLHVARAPETEGLIGEAELASMKRGAILVNTARGGIVDEAALVRHLRSGHLGGAALDVFDAEPPDPKSPLLDLPRVVLAPHIGSASHRTRARMAELAVDNLRAGLAGRPLPACANPQAQAQGEGRGPAR
jgi:glyoxylate reductase